MAEAGAGTTDSAAAAGTALAALVRLVDVLRSENGCPWDREQRLPDLRAYLLEEAHELAAAIDRGDPSLLREELGDLVFHLAFIGSLAREHGWFELKDAIEHNHHKMIERHPHIFGARREPLDRAAVERAWQERKRTPGASILDGVPETLPALTGALRLSQKAAGIGFDWPDVPAVMAKLDEELAELRQQLQPATLSAREEAAAELGDLLFVLANLARHLGCDPEAALAAANLKFRRRFAYVEQHAAGKTTNLAALEELWQEAKRLGR